MSNGNKKKDSTSNSNAVIVAFFGLLSVIIPALLVNWDKVFSSSSAEIKINRKAPTEYQEPNLGKNPSDSPPDSSLKLPKTISAEILQPLNGASLDREAKVEGTLQTLSPGDSLWIYVYPVEQNIYYPFQVTYNPDNKSWSIPLTIGAEEKEESGAFFKIGIFTADSAQSTDLREWRENGTYQLPPGIKILTSITIRRN
jgi:hypothetical protein